MPESINLRSMAGSLAPVFLLRVLASAGALFLLVFSARWYGVIGRADISMFMLWITLHGVMNEWLGGAQLVFWYQRINTARLLRVMFLWTLVTSGLLSVVACLSYFNWEMILLLWISFFVQAFNATLMHLYNAMGKLRKAALVNVLPTMVLMGMMIVREIIKGSNSNDYYVMYPLSFLFSLIIGLSGIRYLSDLSGSPSMAEWLRRGLVFLVTGIGFILSGRVSFFVVEHLSGKEALGKYSVALSLCEVLMIAPGILSTWFYSEVSKNPGLNHDKTQYRLTRISLLCVSGGALFFYLVPEEWILLVVGDGFTGLSDYFLPFFLAYILLSGSVIRTHYFSGKGNFSRNMLASVTGLVATLVLGIFALLFDFSAITRWMPFAGFFVLLLMTWRREKDPIQEAVASESMNQDVRHSR